MGQTSSKSKVESITNSLLSVLSSVAAEAGVTVSASNIINLQNCTIDRLEIKQDSYVKVDTSVLQNISSDTNVSNEMEQQVEQITQAEAPNLNFNLGGVKAETFASLVTNLSTSLQQSIAARCTQTANLTNAFFCTESSLNYVYIEQGQVGDFFFECTQNLQSVITAKNDLETFIAQQTKSETKDVIFAILMAIAAIIVVIIVAALVLPWAKNRFMAPPPRTISTLSPARQPY